MNIHLPAILGFTRYQGFDPSPFEDDFPYKNHDSRARQNSEVVQGATVGVRGKRRAVGVFASLECSGVAFWGLKTFETHGVLGRFS